MRYNQRTMSNCEAVVVIPAHNEAERIGRTLASLSIQSGINMDTQPAIVVVDNNSSDGTTEVAKEFTNNCGPFTLHILSEDQQGVAATCDTGFRYAIDELGAKVIARLDADTNPMTEWFQALTSKHARKPRLALLTGPVLPGLEGDPRKLDMALLPSAKFIGRIIKAVRYRELGMLRFVPGHNMSTTAHAYDTVGGFTRATTLTDDVDYNLKIMREFGIRAIGKDRDMMVFTSSRRLRELGYLGAAKHYLHDQV